MPKVTLFTDGSCSRNPGPGGWACLMRCGEVEKMISGRDDHTTNNRMEMMGAICGLEALTIPSDVTVVSDSALLINAWNKGWIKNWMKNGWMSSSGEVKNQDLWKRLIAVVNTHSVTWKWVKGHAGHPDNERVDARAQAEARS